MPKKFLIALTLPVLMLAACKAPTADVMEDSMPAEDEAMPTEDEAMEEDSAMQDDTVVEGEAEVDVEADDAMVK